MDTGWLREALFAGMTSNAFKLGTVLTCGWFWPRVSGCSVLYRGNSMDTIDFTNVLTVAEADAPQISPPDYVQHNSSSAYFYVVRRANSCGDQEHTLSAAVRVLIDAEGNLAEPRPNKIFGLRGKQVDGDRVELVWYYCPLEHEQKPVCFKVYYDGGTGQIDYQNPVVTIPYAGRKFYSYQSSSLEQGRYLFCVRAEGTSGTESSSAQIGIQLDTESPAAIDILSAEAI
jgi:hypothetical protein